MVETKDKVIQKSIYWSGLGEIGAKLIVPISTMILARILKPDDFGVIAISNMVVFFADIITDAGFGKYIVQADFKDEKEKDCAANVAFWSHIILSLIIWIGIAANQTAIATLLGGAEYAGVITVASTQLIIMSVISTQLGLLRRNFEFKKLFVVRVCTALVPLIVTVPLAIWLKTYWALVIGNICGYFVSALILFALSTWYPRFYYSWHTFKRMFSFSFWSLCEGLANWMIFWFDTFIIAQIYSSYYVGLYKNSTAMVMSIIGMITATMSPVLLAVMSRMKNDKELYSVFLHIEKLIMYILFPMGVIMFFYRDLATLILFGGNWTEAADIVGVWTLMMMISVVIYSFPAEAFKSQGIPKYLFLYQLIYLLCLIPICIYTSQIGFWEFVYARAAGIGIQLVLFFFFIKRYLHWDIKPFLVNLVQPSFAALSVVFLCLLIYRDNYSLFWCIASGVLVFLLTLGIMYLFFRKNILLSIHKIRKKEITMK